MSTPIQSDPKHLGARIQIARMWRAKHPEDVAAALGVAPSTYRGYESGYGIPSGLIDQLSHILEVPATFFIEGPDTVIPSAGLTFRKKVRLKAPPTVHVRAAASLLPMLNRYMSRFVNLPPVRVPVARATGLVEIEKVVSRMRSTLGLVDAPLASALDLVESLGVAVFWVSSDPDFDAVSFWHEDRPYILLNEAHRDGHRVRLTVLHELGHLTLHRRGIDVDVYEDEGDRREADANLFAGAWLMPAVPFSARFSRYWSVMDVLDERPYWRASCAAIVRRAKDLKLISDDRYRQLYIGISSNGWRKREPGAPEPERSRVHQFFFEEAWDAFGLPPARVAAEIGLPLSWLFETMPQARAYDRDSMQSLPDLIK